MQHPPYVNSTLLYFLLPSQNTRLYGALFKQSDTFSSLVWQTAISSPLEHMFQGAAICFYFYVCPHSSTLTKICLYIWKTVIFFFWLCFTFFFFFLNFLLVFPFHSGLLLFTSVMCLSFAVTWYHFACLTVVKIANAKYFSVLMDDRRM